MRSVVVEPAQSDRRLKKLAIDMLTALGERDATIAATDAGAALQAMITDESLTVSEAVQLHRSNQPPRSGPASPANRTRQQQR